MKPKRTLGPAAFEAYMNFADSLKNGSNNDSIDRFKYRFAVKEGYIRPKRAITESVGGLSLDDFETAFKGLVGGFLPHLDAEEQEFLGNICTALDEKINGGDLSGAQDVLQGAMRDAGYESDDDESDDDEYVTDEDDSEWDDECECPPGEKCVDGECVPADERDDAGKPNSFNADEQCQGKTCKKGKKAKVEGVGDNDDLSHINPYVNGETSKYLYYDPEDPDKDYPQEFSDVKDEYGELDFDHNRFFGHHPYDGEPAEHTANGFPADRECQDKTCKANSGKPTMDAIDTNTPGFGNDYTEDYSLEDESGEYVDDTFRKNADMDVYSPGSKIPEPAQFSDYEKDYGEPTVDYDALADMILSDNGYGSMTTGNGGVAPLNRRFMDR